MTTARTVSILFPDGNVITGQSATAVLNRWRDKQWTYRQPDEWRDELAKRAWIWSETEVNVYTTPLEFLRQLEAAGLIKITITRGGEQ